MPEELDERWEYWVPDPEIAELMAYNGRLDSYALMDLNDLRTKNQGGNLGVRFGSGNPDSFEPRERAERVAPERENAVPERVACAACGRDFRPDRNSRRYCSNACRPHPGRDRVLADVACRTCGVVFRPDCSKTIYCSRRCCAAAQAGRPAPKIDVDEVALVRMYLGGAAMADVCAAIGMTACCVRRRLHKLGVQMRPGHRPRRTT